MPRAQVTVPLDIPDVRVLKTEINKVGELIITIESAKEGTLCRQCGREIRKRHGYDEWVIIRHLPVFGRPSYLRYRPRRYQCMECEGHPTTTQCLDWRERNSPHSMAYDDHLLLQLVNSTVEDVSYDCVLGVLERRISASVDWWEYSALGVVGMDEIALKKGHRNFVEIVTARLAQDRVVILAVLPDRQKDTLIEFLRSIPQRLLQTIHTVCCDKLAAIFDQRLSLPRAKTKIRAWIKRVARSELRCFDKFLHTLGRWWVEILNYFVNRDNSGFVEGLNNKLKVLKRRCYGLFNLAHLFQRIFLDLEGYRLFADRPPYVAHSR